MTLGVPPTLGDELLWPTSYANIWGNIADLTLLAAFRGSTQKVDLFFYDTTERDLLLVKDCEPGASLCCPRRDSAPKPIYCQPMGKELFLFTV